MSSPQPEPTGLNGVWAVVVDAGDGDGALTKGEGDVEGAGVEFGEGPGEEMAAVVDDAEGDGEEAVVSPPAHATPASHTEHVVLIVGVPPLVSDPLGQTVHSAELDALYSFSTPHAMHGDRPVPLYVPAAHGEQYALAEVVAVENPAPAAHANTVTAAQPAVFVPVLYVLPATQLVHEASFADGDPCVYPRPAPHSVVEWGLQIVCPLVSAYLPTAQFVHGLMDRNDFAAGPNLPASHAMPLQRGWSLVVVYWPGRQSWQPPSLYFPATHVEEHVCVWSTALLRYLPVGHVLAVHGELLVSTEYLPLPHGSQNASAVAVPALTPSPVGQGGVVCELHELASSTVLYVPVAQLEHVASSAVVVPSV